MKLTLALLALAAAFAFASAAFADTDVALGMPCTANASANGCDPSRAVDGDFTKHWSGPSQASPNNPYYLVVDLLKPYSLNSIVITGAYSQGVWPSTFGNDYNLYISPDSSDNWQLLGSYHWYDDPVLYRTTTDLPGLPAEKIKYEVTGGLHFALAFELQAFAATPEPASLALVALATPLFLRRRRSILHRA